MEDTYLIKGKDAVEVITEDNISIPQWQMDKVEEAVKYAEENPSTLMDWESVKQNIKRDR